MPSLLEGIEVKYGKEVNCELDIPILYVSRKNENFSPQILVFNDFGIDSAGSEESLKSKCRNVQELDLAKNCLSQWSEVVTILRIMPRLEFANLSFNSLNHRLSDDLLYGSFPRLKNLILNATFIEWLSVQKLLDHIPSLEELHLSLNGYNHIHLEDLSVGRLVVHEGMRKFYFTANAIGSWSEVCKLGRSFPKLEALILADCPISSLDPSSPSSSPDHLTYQRSESECEGSQPIIESPHHCFRNLKFLNLNNTLLSSWEDIDHLACFPSLQHLRIYGLPLFEPQEYTKHERRQLLIARLPNICTLNGGGEIGHDDREDAERAFIRHYMDKPESDRPERYNDLVGIHGKLDPLVNIDLSPARSVKINLVFGSKTESRSVDVYQTVVELKQKLETFANLHFSKMRLFYVDQEMKACHGPEEMKFPNKQLYSYNINSGDEIIVDSKH